MMTIHINSLKAAILVVILTLFVSGALIGCSSNENFDGKYTGSQKTNDGYEKQTKMDVTVEDNYMTVKMNITDEYDDPGDYDTDEVAGECKYNKKGNAIYFKASGRTYELRKLQGKYHLIVKTKFGVVKNDVPLKKK